MMLNINPERILLHSASFLNPQAMIMANLATEWLINKFILAMRLKKG